MNNVENPNHYQLDGLEPYETLDVINSVLGVNARHFYIGNILKYVMRAEKKNGLEDYKKARQYLDWLIELDSLTDAEREALSIKTGTELLLLDDDISQSDLAATLSTIRAYLNSLSVGDLSSEWLEDFKKVVDETRPLAYDNRELYRVLFDIDVRLSQLNG